jgi:TPR repeat protein
LYKKAALMNNVDAMLNLGSYYEKIDLKESIKYYENASKMDNSWGLLNLGLIYLEMEE